MCQPRFQTLGVVRPEATGTSGVKTMVTAFEIVTFVVVSLAVVACFTPFFSIRRAMASLGRQGAFWFEHPEDRTVEERPDEDATDAALPRRPLRARY